MKLRADQIVAPDHRGNWSAVIGVGQAIRRIGAGEAEGMHEIGMIAGRDGAQHRMVGPIDDQIVPAHMRHLQRRVGGHQRHDLTRNPAEALIGAVLEPAAGHQLHADADAEERARAGDRHLFQRLAQIGDFCHTGQHRRERALAGQRHAVGAAHRLRIVGDGDGDIAPAIGGRALESLGRGAEIARPGIDDNDGFHGAVFDPRP